MALFKDLSISGDTEYPKMQIVTLCYVLKNGKELRTFLMDDLLEKNH